MPEKFTVRMLREAAESLGVICVVEPTFGHVGYLESEEKRFFFKLSALDINPLGASRIALDKAYTQYFLQKFGYSTIPTEVFFSDAWCAVNNTNNNLSAALDYVEQVGYPRIVKPNSKSQGRGVTKVHSSGELSSALEDIFFIDAIALIQPCIPGNDYRIVVYKDSVVAAYSRTPLTIFSDGVHTIRELLPTQNLPVRTIEVRLRREYDLTLDSVPNVGQSLQLLDNANLSTGGTARDVTHIIHESFKKLAIQATHDMGLVFAGIDMLTTGDISKPMIEYSIVEVNSMPGLEHYAGLGSFAISRVQTLYQNIVRDFLKIDNEQNKKGR